jgi:hypothetical protein
MAPKPRTSRPPARPRTERVAAAAQLAAEPARDPVAERGAKLDAAYKILDADLDRIWGDYHASQDAAWTVAQGRMEDAARHYAATVATIRGAT